MKSKLPIIVTLIGLCLSPQIICADEAPDGTLLGGQPTKPTGNRPKAPSNVYIYVDYFGGCMSITSEAELGLLDVTLTSNTTAQTWHYSAVTLGTPVLMQLPDDSYTLVVESDSWTFTCYDFCVD